MNSCLYFGDVMHQRFKPHRHEFTYRFISWYLDLDELAQLDRRLIGFGYNRPGLFRFNDKDFGPGVDQPLSQFIRDLVQQAGLGSAHRIMLLCQPRCLGYIFNSISVYFCFDENEELIATIYEVSNTRQERHLYLTAADQHRPLKQHADKAMYVSPFMEMQCRYRFKVQPPAQRFSIQVIQDDQEGTLFQARWRGEQQVIDNKTLFKLACRPPMTLKTIASIHWQALKLWIKRTPIVDFTPTAKFQVSRGGLGWKKESSYEAS